MALDKITTGIINDDAVTSAKIPADAIGTTEIANDVTISTSGNIATTSSGTLTVAGISTLTGAQTMTGDTTHNGNVILATNKKIKAKGEAMTHSLHRSWVLGG